MLYNGETLDPNCEIRSHDKDFLPKSLNSRDEQVRIDLSSKYGSSLWVTRCKSPLWIIFGTVEENWWILDVRFLKILINQISIKQLQEKVSNSEQFLRQVIIPDREMH